MNRSSRGNRFRPNICSSAALVCTKILLLIGFLFAASADSFAFPPFRTEDGGTSIRGVFSAEIGDKYLTTDDGDTNSATLTLTYGLTDKIEPALDFNFHTIMPEDGDDESGFGDMAISAKLQIVNESKFPVTVLVKPSLQIPTGHYDKGTGTGEEDIGLLLVIEKTFGSITAKGNFGYFVADLNDDFDDRFFYGFEADAYIYQDKLGVGAEITGEFGFVESPTYALFGVFYQINKIVSANAGIEFGINDAASAFAILGGLSFSFFQP